MSHWFDRLATWSAEGRDDGEERLLTRRQAVRAAATGAGAVGLLGSPLVGNAFGLGNGNSPECQCWDKANRINNKANRSLVDNLGPAAVISPAVQVIFFTALLSTTAAYLGHVVHCGLCRDDPPLEPPPPKAQPCTHRGGLALHDQCGGAPPPSGGGQTCPNGTHECTDGLCCFGTDLCCANCGTGQCCIVEVGCACCG
jgi:hypothetical protein